MNGKIACIFVRYNFLQIFCRSKKRKFTLFISESVPNAAHYASAIKHLTDLHLVDLIQFPLPIDKITDDVIVQAQVKQISSPYTIFCIEVFLIIYIHV